MNDDTFVPRGSARAESTVIGIVVPIPEPWAQLLVDWRAKVGDPQASLVPPHVTLLPPTEVAVADRTTISAHLAQVARCHSSFDMHLSGTGTFRPVSDVVFVAVARGIGNCELLANDVRSYLNCYRVFATADAEIAPELPRITVPALAITGENDPGSTPEMTRRLADAIPGCRAVVVPGARHMLPVERPREFVTCLTTFIGERAHV